MKINFGIGRSCINPELPISLAGYFNKRMWNRILDDIEVRAVVFKAQGKEFAVINFDLLCIPITLYNEIFAAFSAANLPFTAENTLICAIHTHTAPDVNNDPNSPAYRKFAAAKAAQALSEALANTEDGELFTAMAHSKEFQFNRRYWMKDGNVLTNPGKLNPDIDRPEGDIDPEIPLLAVKNADGKIKLLFSSIVNHTDTIGGCGVSSDWCGFMRRELEAELAENSMVVPLIGASGNINHFDVFNDFDQTCYDEPCRIGRGYAASIRTALQDLQPLQGDDFNFATAVVNSVPREIDEAEVAEARKIVAEYADIDINACGDLTSEDLVKKTPVVLKFFAEKLIAQSESTNNPQFRLSGIKFGNTVIASLPSEPFVEIGLALRKSIFNGRHCLVTSHGNYNGGESYFGGYIPNIWNYGRGGYETTPRSNGYSIHTADLLLEAWKKLAEKL